jgi:hypothetical protein
MLRTLAVDLYRSWRGDTTLRAKRSDTERTQIGPESVGHRNASFIWAAHSPHDFALTAKQLRALSAMQLKALTGEVAHGGCDFGLSAA